MLKEGDKAPEFELAADGGRVVKASELAGKAYVVYFYPKDNTPGCTTEACDFRDHFARVTAAGAEVLGVSTDSVRSHDGFKKKHELPFTLLSDPDKTLHAAFGAWGKKQLYGKEYDGTIRSTFLVGPDGKVAKAWPTVKVKGHADEVLSALEALGKGGAAAPAKAAAAKPAAPAKASAAKKTVSKAGTAKADAAKPAASKPAKR